MFMGANSKCAHQVRPPPGGTQKSTAVRKPDYASDWSGLPRKDSAHNVYTNYFVL